MWPFRKREPTAEENAAEMVVMLFESEREKWAPWTGSHGLEKGYLHNELECAVFRRAACSWEAKVDGMRISLSSKQQGRIVGVLDRESDERKIERVRSFAQKIIDRAA